MNKKCIGIILALLLIILAGIYKFILHESAVYKAVTNEEIAKEIDGRTIMQLTTDERVFVLKEMRSFVESVQKIIKGISDDDMNIVAEYAKKSGASAQQGMPVTLHKKLPVEFKKLGHSTHSQFDQIALDAQEFSDREHALQQISVLMENCVSCHAMYKIKEQ